MKSVICVQIGANHSDMARSKARAVTQIRAHGTQRIPDLPRGITVQPGQGGALVTFHLPKRYNDVTGYRIYSGSEKNLSIQIRDRGTRQQFVPLTAGENPPTNNIFVSAVNGFRESGRIQIQTKAKPSVTTSTVTTPTTPPTTTTTTTPVAHAVPQPTQDFLSVFSGGWDKTMSGQPTGKKTP